jgi:hypothetical protein
MRLRFWNRPEPSSRDVALRALEDLKHDRLLRPRRFEQVDKRDLSLTELISYSAAG